MAPFVVEKIVVLTSPSAVRAILKFSDEHRTFVVQDDLITLLKDGEILSRLALITEPPYCVVSDTLVALSKRRLIFVTADGIRLRKRTASISEEVEVMCAGSNCFYWSCNCTLYRHDTNDQYRIMKTFGEPIRALSATATKLLVMLSTNLHVLDLETQQDLVEVSCDVVNPVSVFWSISASSSFWFMAVVAPRAMDENRTYSILMAEVNERVITSEDVTPEGVPLERRLHCTAKNDKMLTLADNGNVVLIHGIDNFGKLNLLYRGEATDTSFTAAEMIRVPKGSSAPRIALGTSNGAVLFMDEP